MLTGEGPPPAVLFDAQSMADREMAFEHLAVPATIEADDIIAMNGLPDRDGRCPRGRLIATRFQPSLSPVLRIALT